MKLFNSLWFYVKSSMLVITLCAAPTFVSAIEMDPNFVNACVSLDGRIEVIDNTGSCLNGDTLVKLPTQSNVAALSTSFVAYTNRAVFAAAAGTTTMSDFTTFPAGDNHYSSYEMSGVTFNTFNSYWNLAIYRHASYPNLAEIKIDLPPGTRAVGANLGSFYGEPGTLTMVLSNGQETSTASGTTGVNPGVFMGVVSAKPIEWVKFKLSSACLPTTIYGVKTCPGFPDNYAAGYLMLKNFTYGPGL